MKIKQHHLRYACIAALCSLNIAFGVHAGSFTMILTGIIGLCYIPAGLAFRRQWTLSQPIAE